MKPTTMLKVLANLDLALASLIMAFLVLVTFAGVLMRYFFSAPLNWLEEVQLWSQVWIAFLGGGAAFRAGGHVVIEILVDLFPKKLQKITGCLIGFAAAIVLCYLFYQSLGYIHMFTRSGRSTSMLRIPYWLIYGIAPVSFVIMIASYFYAAAIGVKTEAKAVIDSAAEPNFFGEPGRRG
ncbi:MAG: TRAP transporter small permease subunit [Synergistaceae bacterium]|jgi:TRAP-type C4-dicarboxylate transport system permease small subunit|nr:TRAP transporter small permease subunit [Synergistaceae bacterium]